MPRHRREVKRRLTALTHDQELELIVGPHPDRPAFEGESARRAAWDAHADELRALVAPAVPWGAEHYARR